MDRPYWGRAAFVTGLSLFYPLTRLRELLFYQRAVERVAIEKDPIFIIGHWRSGTTHLHNLICHDPQFGYVTTFQSQTPKTFLAARKTVRPIMAAFMPRTRPMDNVAIDTELPQEEEFCLCNACLHSFYLYNFFPRTADDGLFAKWILFDGVSAREFEEWKAEYVEVVKKATFNMGGKQLVLKNPCNTARMEAVLRVFPSAKFIHIYRNPYTVFKSTLRLREDFERMMAFQVSEPERRRRNTLEHYRLMMSRYFETKERIPKSQLAEVRYEDLEKDPLGELARVYDELGIGGWDEARGAIAEYVETLRGYRKNEYRFDEGDIAAVSEHWGFAVRRLGYGGGECKMRNRQYEMPNGEGMERENVKCRVQNEK